METKLDGGMMAPGGPGGYKFIELRTIKVSEISPVYIDHAELDTDGKSFSKDYPIAICEGEFGYIVIDGWHRLRDILQDAGWEESKFTKIEIQAALFVDTRDLPDDDSDVLSF